MPDRIHIVALITLTAVATACGGGSGPTSPPPAPGQIEVAISPATVTVAAGQTQQFTATVTNTTNTAVTWTANAGTIQGAGATITWTAPVSGGSASVTATSAADPTRSRSALVTVTAPSGTPVATITLDRSVDTLVPQQPRQVTAVVRDAAGNSLAGRAVTWSSSSPGVASVSGGLITALSPGQTTVSASSEGKSATVAVTVVQGGMLSVGGGALGTQDGTVTITVPAGAVGAPGPLTITPVSNPAGSPLLVLGTAYEFGPSQTFAQPVTLAIRFAPAQLPVGVPASSLRLHRLTGGVWVEVPGSNVDLASSRVTGQTSSFSTYALVGKLPAQEVVITWDAGQPSATCAAGAGLQCGVTLGGGWVVPENVYTATFELYGASGGGMGGVGMGRGKGGKTVATITVYPGESFQIRTGAAGNTQGAFNGGGRGGFGNIFPLLGGAQIKTDGSAGGGATDVRRGTVTLQDFPGYPGRILVAGGGGGDGGALLKYTPGGSFPIFELLGPGAPGGHGGGLVGGDGGNGTALSYVGGNSFSAPTGGRAGSTQQPGAAGVSSNWLGFDVDKFNGQPESADPFWGGGRGGHAQQSSPNGNGGGGGGGGWQGGGGGGSSYAGEQMAAGGGGGSSWGPDGTTFERGVHTGHGRAVLRYTPSPGLIPTVTTGTPSITPIPTSGSFTVAATVTLKPPAQGPVTGTVRFEVDGVLWGSGPVPIQNGQAVSAPISGLPAGSHTITVSYLGNGNLAPSGTNFLIVVGP